jgi:hypothetical protein
LLLRGVPGGVGDGAGKDGVSEDDDMVEDVGELAGQPVV